MGLLTGADGSFLGGYTKLSQGGVPNWMAEERRRKQVRYVGTV